MMPDLVSTSGSSCLALLSVACGPLVVVLRLDLFEQARHGLDVVVEDLRAGVHHDPQRFHAALEIGDEHLDRAAGVQSRGCGG